MKSLTISFYSDDMVVIDNEEVPCFNKEVRVHCQKGDQKATIRARFVDTGNLEGYWEVEIDEDSIGVEEGEDWKGRKQFELDPPEGSWVRVEVRDSDDDEFKFRRIFTEQKTRYWQPAS